MNEPRFDLLFRNCTAGVLSVLAAGCGTLRPADVPQPSFYSLDGAAGATARTQSPAGAPTLIVNPPHAASGFDSQRIIYAYQPHKLEYFAHSEWVDTPARMIAPLIATAVENSGAFRAVVLTPSTMAGDLRLDTEIVRLQQDFDRLPSRVRFTLRAYLLDNSTHRVLAWREFDQSVSAASEDPYGGVLAANRAVQAALEHLAAFCAEVAGNGQLAVSASPARSGADARAGAAAASRPIP